MRKVFKGLCMFDSSLRISSGGSVFKPDDLPSNIIHLLLSEVTLPSSGIPFNLLTCFLG
jgi:hypothetical protein